MSCASEYVIQRCCPDCPEACETEKTVFTGYFVSEDENHYIILLVYVDDLTLGSKSTRAAKHLVKMLAKKVNIKLTGILSEDKKGSFLGRSIRRDNQTDGILVSLPEGHVKTTREARGIKKPSPPPPDLRKILDDGMEVQSQQQALRPEASARHRSAVGKIAWGAQTMIGLTYFISILSRGQSQPLAVFEACLRAFLSERILICQTPAYSITVGM